MNLGQRLRFLREQKGLLLREVAAHLEIDTAMISKIERGEKHCKKEHLSKLAEILDTSEKDLTVLWLSDSVFSVIENELFAVEALNETLKRVQGSK